MRYSALVNGRYVVAANNIKTLKRKASMICNKENNVIDEMLVEGLGKRNHPIFFCRVHDTTCYGKTHCSDWR